MMDSSNQGHPRALPCPASETAMRSDLSCDGHMRTLKGSGKCLAIGPFCMAAMYGYNLLLD